MPNHPTIEKGRYLELNGDAVESGRLSRFFRSVAFSTALITQVIGHAISDDHISVAAAAPAQGFMIFMGRLKRKKIIQSFFKDDYDHLVIDTRPLSGQKTSNENLNKSIIQVYGGTTALSLVGPPFTYFFNPLLMVPYFSESLADILTFKKVKDGKWVIISRDQMKQEEKVEHGQTKQEFKPA